MMHYEKYDLIIFTQTFYPDLNATAKLMYDLAEYLVKKGLKVLVSTPNRSYENPNKTYDINENISGVDVERVKVPNLNKNSGIQKILLYYIFSKKTKKIIRKHKFENSMSILPPFFVANKVLKETKKQHSKFIFLLHDLHPDTLVRRKQASNKNPLIKILKKQNEYIFKNSDKCIFLGRDQIDYVKKEYSINDEKIKLIPNWARKNKTCSLKNNNIKDFKILYAGNLGESSVNLMEFLKIMKQIEKKDKNIKMTILGNGRKKDLYINYINENNLKNVEIKSFLPEKEYIEELNKSDAFLVTLREESKGMSVPSKTYYYLSAGKPIIGMLPVNSEIDLSMKEDNYGFNINYLSDKEKEEKILELKNNSNYYNKLKKNSLNSFNSKYKKDIVLEKYYQLIKELEEK